MKYRGEPTRCEIGARTQIREHCTIHRGTATGRGLTSVGADCMLMAVAHVAHDCTVGDHVIIANNAVMGGHVGIGDHAVIGGAAAIHQFVRIGRAAMIGGVSGVEADVIPFGSVIGNRARLAGLNVVGLKRRGFDKGQIQLLHNAFRDLFRRDGVFAQRLAAVRANYGDEALIAEVLAFVDAPSHRGLIRAE
jgi:UDP-N-acetylglucosamine acyltransferase